MRFTRTKATFAAVGLALSLAACGEAGSSEDEGRDVQAEENAADKFDDGTRMKELAEAGKVTVGVKYDQPGLGFKGATDELPSGFDVEIAKLLVADLGIDPSDTEAVNYKETISDNREPFLQAGEVDLVLASYSITDERRQVVGQTGPYMVTGQQLLVKKGSDIKSVADIKGQEVCSVTGSTSLDNVEAEGAKPRGFDTYSECRDQVLDGTVDAMTTDGSILLGYAALNPDELEVVGEPFSEERIGVGYPKENPEMCEWINGVLQEAYDDGSWADAFELTLGKSGVETPEPPALDDCPAA
jgi:glutamate transport system substrate-binding protein